MKFCRKVLKLCTILPDEEEEDKSKERVRRPRSDVGTSSVIS